MPVVGREAVVRAAFYAVLVPAFLASSWHSFCKLSDGVPGTVLSGFTNSTLDLPAVTVCSGDHAHLAPNATLEELYGRLKDAQVVKYATFTDQESRILHLTDEATLKANFGITLEEAWRTTYVWISNFRFLTKCVTLMSFLEVAPTLSPQVAFGTDERVYMILHEEYQTTPGFNTRLGNEPYIGFLAMQENTMQLIEVTRKVVTRLSKEGDQCDEQNKSKFELCLEEYAKRNLDNCSLPWEPDGKGQAPCGKKRFTEVVNEYGSEMTQMADIRKVTGCVANCRTVNYSARMMYQKPTIRGLANATFTFMLAMPQTSTVEEREVLTYDRTAFIADVGGVLGLLLGLSVMDLARLIDRAAVRVGRILKKNTKEENLIDVQH